ncbi:MAG: methyltransferase domain-containing protein [Pirellulales bacterium]|nr:methyltransferase domain-containing protein [Thermoguttaceae bacterium]MDD4788191.1 methyltransferase domain-containing protein [Pirellulales bacterium]MDI9443115.1 methyltransferase domain-containing protein [Planctomycetota bacterium]
MPVVDQLQRRAVTSVFRAVAMLPVAVGLVLAVSAAGRAAFQEASAPPAKAARAPDVVYVPTPHDVVDKMLEMARVKKEDVVYDLGCGDGRIVVAAAKKGAKAIGYDLSRERVEEARANVKKNKVEKLAEIFEKDIFTLDLSEANVITLYLLPKLNVKLIPQLEKLKPGSRIVSHDFDMKGVQPDRMVHMTSQEDGESHTIYLWTVPLKKEPGHEPTGQQ